MVKIRPGRVWAASELPRGVRPIRAHAPLFNALTATAEDLQKMMIAGKLLSTQLVEEYIWRTQEYNHWLNAICEFAPTCMEQAENADEKRRNEKSSGPMLGIPVWIKENIATDSQLGMGTTAGAVSLLGSTPKGNSPLVQQLLDAGAIILGKTTMSEMAFHKGTGLPCGWSAISGHANSPYVWGGIDLSDQSVVGHSSPGGSSSGSAIAVAAGLGPIAIGTETEGSLIVPSTRASLYTIKPSLKLIPQKLIVPISKYMDSAGPMTKSPADLANLLSAIVDPNEPGGAAGGYAKDVTRSWAGLRVGVVDPTVWTPPPAVVKPVPAVTEEILTATKSAYKFIQERAHSYHENVTLRSSTDFELDGQKLFPSLMDASFEEDLNAYLGELAATKVRTLQEMIDFNTAYPEVALREYENQAHLLNGRNFSQHDLVQSWLDHAKTIGQSLPETLEKYDIDVIIGPGDCSLTSYAVALECPIGTLPLSYSNINGRPIGLQVLAPRHREDLIIRVMSAWESTWTQRKTPEEFLKHLSYPQIEESGSVTNAEKSKARVRSGYGFK